MIELVEANWLLFVIVLVVGLLVAWWIFIAMRRTGVETDRTDVLDDGKGPAARNQALMDAPPAAGPTPAAAMPPSAGPPPAGPSAPATVDEQPAAADTVMVTPTEVSPIAPTDDPVLANTVRPVAKTPAPDGSDDITLIKGIGPKLSALLAEHGVTRFDQIAAWNDADIDAIDVKLGKFQGRIRRDAWVTQAQMLQAGDTAAYEGRFGKL